MMSDPDPAQICLQKIAEAIMECLSAKGLAQNHQSIDRAVLLLYELQWWIERRGIPKLEQPESGKE